MILHGSIGPPLAVRVKQLERPSLMRFNSYNGSLPRSTRTSLPPSVSKAGSVSGLKTPLLRLADASIPRAHSPAGRLSTRAHPALPTDPSPSSTTPTRVLILPCSRQKAA